MIVVSQGLEVIASKDQYQFLHMLLSKSFKIKEAYNLMDAMENMKQYFFFKNNKPIAVVSFRKKGYLNCTGTYHNNVLYNVATSPYYRNKGYMKQLLQHVIKDMKKNRRKYLYLEVLKNNVKAIGLYKKLGFEVIFECAPTSFHQGILLMRLKLR